MVTEPALSSTTSSPDRPPPLWAQVLAEQSVLVRDADLPRFPALTAGQREVARLLGPLPAGAPQLRGAVPAPFSPATRPLEGGLLLELRQVDDAGCLWALEVKAGGLVLSQCAFTSCNLGLFVFGVVVVPSMERRGLAQVLGRALVNAGRVHQLDVVCAMVVNPDVAGALPALGFLETGPIGIGGLSTPGRCFVRPCGAVPRDPALAASVLPSGDAASRDRR